MLNYICNAFVRNDGSPAIAMVATLASSLFNIVMDYVLMFPCRLGMTGAALATVFSPIVGITICCVHFFSKKNTIRLRMVMPSFKRLFASCQLGIAAFVGEMSAGVTTMVFNFLILAIAGNVGVAAYGIVANIAIIATSIFNGISQGSQPLLSDFYGKGDTSSVKKVLHLSVISALLAAGMIIAVMNLFPEQIVYIFNSEKNAEMASYAVDGIRLYFIGFLFAGFNIVGTGYLSATKRRYASRTVLLDRKRRMGFFHFHPARFRCDYCMCFYIILSVRYDWCLADFCYCPNPVTIMPVTNFPLFPAIFAMFPYNSDIRL